MLDSDQAVTLTVAERGPGIPPDAMDKVFEPFFRLEGSRGSGPRGTGLGLGIASNRFPGLRARRAPCPARHRLGPRLRV